VKRRRRARQTGSRFGDWAAALRTAFRSPSVKQREAYTRFFHTLSAAGLIGGVTVVFSESPLTLLASARSIGMFVTAAILFCVGVLFTQEA
jgi:hypothetical protein